MAMQLTPNVRRFLGLDEFDTQQYDDPDDSGPREATPGSVGASPVQPYGPPLSEAGPEMPTSYNDPTSGGTISQPLLPANTGQVTESDTSRIRVGYEPPSYTIQDGRTAPPTQTGTWEPVTNLTQPYDSRVVDEGPRETGPAPWSPLSAQPQPVTPPSTGLPPGRINTGRPFETGMLQGPADTAPPSPTMGSLIQNSRPGSIPELVDNSPAAQQAAITSARGSLPQQPAVRPQPTYRQAPAEEAAAQIEADQSQGYAPTPPRWSLPGSSGRMLAEGVQESQRTGAAISPLTLYSAFSELPFDVYQAAYDRAVIAADRNISGTDPLAPFRGLGINLPSEEDVNPEKRPAAVVLAGLLMSGVLPDPADPYVAAAFRGAGRAIGATGRRLAAEGRTIGVAAGAGAEAGSRALSNAGEAAARNVPAGEERLGSGMVPESGSRRFYHGTASEFGAPEGSKFDPNGLFGPGYYLTDSPVVANSYASERAIPYARDASWVQTHLRSIANQTRQTGAEGAEALARAYDAAAEAVPPGKTFTQDEINSLTSDAAFKAEGRIDFSDDRLWGPARAARDSLSDPTGANVRAVDVPTGVRLLDADRPLTTEQIAAIRGTLTDPVDLRMFEAERARFDDPNDLAAVHAAMDAVATGYRERSGNLWLSRAGFDGISYGGGKRIPIRDDTGRPVEHQAVMIFPESLPRIRNAFSGEQGGSGFIPTMSDARNAAQGAFLGAAMPEMMDPENATPEDRLQRMGIGAVAGLAAGRAGRGGTRVPGAKRAGSGFLSWGGDDPLNAMRGRVVPPDVADTLDFPVRVPTDPAHVRAIEAAGGSVDPERGVTMNVIRNQGPEAHGGVATRGSVFYVAGEKGAPNPYASSVNDPNRVGGTERIEGMTRFRSPLIISDAPGSSKGFEDAVTQLNLRTPEFEAAQRALDDVNAANRQVLRNREEVMRRWAAETGHKRDDWAAFEQTPQGQQATSELRASWEQVDAAEAALKSAQGSVPTARAIDQSVEMARRAGPAGSPARAEALKDVVRRFGGTPDEIDDLLRIRGDEADESQWAIRENILAAHARRNGYDGVVTVQAAPQNFGSQMDQMEAIENHPLVKAGVEKVGAAAEAYRLNSGPETRKAMREAQAELNAARDTAREELRPYQITELADVREARNPTLSYPRVAELEQAIQDAHARGAPSSEFDALYAQMNDAWDNPSTGYTLRDDIPRRADAGAAPDPRFMSPSKASGIVPFDPASAAAGVGAGAEVDEDGNPVGVDPLRAAGGMAVAGILGKNFPKASQWYKARAAQNANRIARSGKAPLSATEWLRSLAGNVGYSSMLGPGTLSVNIATGIGEPLWSIPKETVRGVTRAVQRRSMEALREQGEMQMGALYGMTRLGEAIVDVLKGQGKYAPNPNFPTLSQQTVNPIGQLLAQAIEAPGRVWSGLPDAIFGTIAQHAGEAREAAQIATDKGLKGAQWKSEQARLLTDARAVAAGQLPTSTEVQRVVDAGAAYANRQTYRDDLGKIGEGVEKVAKLGNAPVLGTWASPFFKTIWTAGVRQAEKSPLGAVMNSQPTKLDKRYDAIVGGTVVLGLAGYGASGGVTGSGPADPKERELLREKGWQPYSTLVSLPGMEPRYVPNRMFGIFEGTLNAAGEVHDAFAYQKPDADARARFEGAMRRTGQLIRQNPYAFQGIVSILDAYNDGPIAAVAGEAARMTPFGATARTVGMAKDTQERTTDRGKGVDPLDEFTQRWQLSTGQRSELPVAQDAFGQPRANQRPGLAALLPNIPREKAAPIADLFREARMPPGNPKPELRMVEGDSNIPPMPLKPSERRLWDQKRGEILLKAGGSLAADQKWKDAPLEQKREILRDLMQTASAAADSQVKASIGSAEINRRMNELMAKKKAS